MVELYGEAVLPAQVVELINCRLGCLNHVCEEGADHLDTCRRFFEAFRRHILVLEERPTVTRFWKFAACVSVLLLIILLGIDTRQVFRLSRTKPQEVNSKRLARFFAFMEAATTGAVLRTKALCLRLTMHATSLTAQKQTTVEGRAPTAVRLSQGEVQEKTCQQLCRIIILLPK